MANELSDIVRKAVKDVKRAIKEEGRRANRISFKTNNDGRSYLSPLDNRSKTGYGSLSVKHYGCQDVKKQIEEYKTNSEKTTKELTQLCESAPQASNREEAIAKADEIIHWKNKVRDGIEQLRRETQKHITTLTSRPYIVYEPSYFEGKGKERQISF